MNDATLLHRQIHPKWVLEGRPTSQAFRPAPKDWELLSAYDGDQIHPEPSYVHYTQSLQLTSCGVCSITVAECTAEGLPTRPDPAHFPEHAVIDFTNIGRSEADRKAKKLRGKAVERGWQYGPAQDAEP